MKICTKCNIEKNINEFSPRQSRCKTCRKDENLAKYWEGRDRKKFSRPVINGKKMCSVCLKEKDIKNFHVNKNCSTGLSSQCKECFETYCKKNFASTYKTSKVHPWSFNLNRK